MTEFSSIFISDLFDNVVKLMEEIRIKYVDQLNKQGHNDTGRLAKSGKIQTQFIPLGIRSSLLLESYFEYLERPLKGADVPFQRGSGKKRSRLVQALFSYFQRKGVSDYERATFATINSWKNDQRPSRASRRFSSIGTRIRPLGNVLEELDREVEKMFTSAGDQALDKVIINMAENTRRSIQ